ncbi:phage major capsid protein, partial [Enterococcus avium]|nr:phage major capsid protein [Enterococcus avium]
MTTLSRGSLFEPELVTDLINKVKGKSSLAILSQQAAIRFDGQTEFVFTMDSE